LIVAAIQLSIMLGAAFGGLLLDHLSIAATMIGGTVLLVLASLIVGNGDRIRRPSHAERAPVNVGAGQPCCALGH
jgi:predicted MFS family arabinose efflux permease